MFEKELSRSFPTQKKGLVRNRIARFFSRRTHKEKEKHEGKLRTEDRILFDQSAKKIVCPGVITPDSENRFCLNSLKFSISIVCTQRIIEYCISTQLHNLKRNEYKKDSDHRSQSVWFSWMIQVPNHLDLAPQDRENRSYFEEQDMEVQVFEMKEHLGGMWLYDEDKFGNSRCYKFFASFGSFRLWF